MSVLRKRRYFVAIITAVLVAAVATGTSVDDHDKHIVVDGKQQQQQPPKSGNEVTLLEEWGASYFEWIHYIAEWQTQVWDSEGVIKALETLTPTPKMQRLGAAVGLMLVDMLPVAFILWYSRLLLGRPEVDGSQFRENIVAFFRRRVFPSYEEYFNLTIEVDTGKEKKRKKKANVGEAQELGSTTPSLVETSENDDEDLCVKPGNQYFFAYHPHGVFPNTIVWLHHSKTWENIVKISGNTIVSFGASIIFNTPFLRDLALTCGSREVSKQGIETAIRQGKSPMLVPGGQSEMIHSWPSKKELHIVTYHHGFVRLAMKHRIPLVPIMCYGEHNVYYNVYLPKLQYWFLRRIGFGFPVLPVGWRCLPLPSRCPLKVVVGVPLNVERIGARTLDFNDPNDVAECAKMYFEHLSQLFYRHRAENGFPDMQLIYHSDKRNPMRGVLQLPTTSSISASSIASTPTPSSQRTTITLPTVDAKSVDEESPKMVQVSQKQTLPKKKNQRGKKAAKK